MRSLVLGLALLVAVSVAQAVEIHTPHCLHGCPQGGEPSDDLIFREIYVLRSNDETKMASWVAYKVTKEAIGKTKPRNWKADPLLAEHETLEPSPDDKGGHRDKDDYRYAYGTFGTERGHQAPLLGFTGTPHWRDINLYSNVTPQKRPLNQGPWKDLERAVRNLARRPDVKAVYVMTGPLFERDMPSLPNADEPHRIPSGYWKIVAIDDGGRDLPRVAGFIFDQNTQKKEKYCDGKFGATIQDIEERTRLTFFHALGEKERGRLDNRPFTLRSGLGC